MKDIYSLSPVNKTAAIVTSQSGCTDSVELSDLRKSKESLQILLDSIPRGHRDRPLLSERLKVVQLELALLRKQKKYVGSKDRNLNEFLMDVIKENTPAYKFKEWLALARAKRDEFISNKVGK